jgi:hypothetical protein
MNCREVEILITAGVYGRLTPEERAELEGHAATCPACAGLLEKWAALIDLRAHTGEEDVPLADWERSWLRIADKAPDKRPRLRWAVFGRPEFGRHVWARRATAAAAVILVFVIGYFAGRSVLFNRSGEAVRTAVVSPAIGRYPLAESGEVVLTEYAANLRTLLVDFLNRSDVRPPESLVELKRRIIRDMLGQTRLLKRLAAGSNDPEMADLLADLEFILTSLANLNPDDKESADHLGRMIREKDVSLRLRTLAAFSAI